MSEGGHGRPQVPQAPELTCFVLTPPRLLGPSSSISYKTLLFVTVFMFDFRCALSNSPSPAAARCNPKTRRLTEGQHVVLTRAVVSLQCCRA